VFLEPEAERALRGEVSVEEIARAWIAYQHDSERSPSDVPDTHWWAVVLWQDDAWWEDEERARRGILAIVRAAETDLDYDVIGAAILEHFVRSDDEDRLRWIETQAAKSEAFRRSLANAWVWGYAPDTVAGRIETAAQTRLAHSKRVEGP
jgi:hypothetical protein